MQSTTTSMTVQVTRYRNDAGDLIGVVYTIPSGQDGRTYYLAEAHDWYSDSAVDGYVATEAGTYADPESAARVIELRARLAQAPETVNETL